MRCCGIHLIAISQKIPNKFVIWFLMDGIAICVFFWFFFWWNPWHNRNRRLLPTSTTDGREPINIVVNAWWRHQMETFSALLALCAGNSPVTGEFPSQRPVTWSFDVFFDLHLNKRLSDLRGYRVHYDLIVMASHTLKIIGLIFSIRSSMELARPIVVQCH